MICSDVVRGQILVALLLCTILFYYSCHPSPLALLIRYAFCLFNVGWTNVLHIHAFGCRTIIYSFYKTQAFWYKKQKHHRSEAEKIKLKKNYGREWNSKHQLNFHKLLSHVVYFVFFKTKGYGTKALLIWHVRLRETISRNMVRHERTETIHRIFWASLNTLWSLKANKQADYVSQ